MITMTVVFTAVPVCWAINQMRKEGWPLQLRRDLRGYLSVGPHPSPPRVSWYTDAQIHIQHLPMEFSRGCDRTKWNLYRSIFNPQHYMSTGLNLFFIFVICSDTTSVSHWRNLACLKKKAMHVNRCPPNDSPYRSGLWRRNEVYPEPHLCRAAHLIPAERTEK